jgi:DNA ligase (NAD+)
MIKSLPDLYRLEPDDFKKLDGFADKSAQKMHSTIHDEKEVELHTFLYALGIRHVGKHVAKLLTRHFSRIKELKNAKREEIEKIEGIGAEIAESIENFFSTEKNIRTVDELFSLGIHIKSGKKKVKQNLTGKTFVITGSLNDYSRSQAKKEVEEHGGHASSSVSANTDYLVAGENPGKKLDDAKENEVEIIDEEKFKQVLTRNI